MVGLIAKVVTRGEESGYVRRCWPLVLRDAMGTKTGKYTSFHRPRQRVSSGDAIGSLRRVHDVCNQYSSDFALFQEEQLGWDPPHYRSRSLVTREQSQGYNRNTFFYLVPTFKFMKA